MDRKEDYKIENLTMLQIQYLIELNKLEKKKGAVRMIAAKCGVNHSQVSRFFKKCIEEGELTESLDFTENGKRKLEWRCKIMRDVRDYLERSGITEGTEEVLKGMIENIDYIQLEKLVKSDRRTNPETKMRKREDVITDIRDILEYGNHEVAVTILQHDGAKRSMADRGFEPVALIRYNKRGAYLELTIREMDAVSRVNGEGMSGHLATLKYLHQGIFRYADIKNGKVRIPLDACYYQNFDNGVLRGNVMITVTCSVGNAHMPENTARVVFKL